MFKLHLLVHTLRQDSSYKILRVSLMLNGQAVVSAGGANDTSASNTILLPLNKDDRVWLQLTRGQLVEIGYDKG